MSELAVAPAVEEEEEPARPSRWRLLIRDGKARFGAGALALLTLAAVFAPWVAPHDPNAMQFMMLDGPSLAHPLGSEALHGAFLDTEVLHPRPAGRHRPGAVARSAGIRTPVRPARGQPTV